MASGIYRILIKRNDLPPFRYIGRAVILRKRWNKHLSELRRGVHKNHLIQKAFAEFGEVAFSFEVLLECEGPREVFEMHEKAFLDKEIEIGDEECILNICREAVGTRKGVAMRQETKDKIGAGNKGKVRSEEHRLAVSLSNSTRVQSEETKAKRSVSMTGKKFPGRVLSEEHKQNVGNSLRGRKRPPEVAAKSLAGRRATAEERGYWIPPEIVAQTAEKNRGKNHSQEHKDKISASLLQTALEKGCASVTKPWEAEGISKTTWYRRKKAKKENG